MLAAFGKSQHCVGKMSAFHFLYKMLDHLSVVLLLSVSVISICSAEENATLVVFLEYPTPYYGDRINFTCMVCQ